MLRSWRRPLHAQEVELQQGALSRDELNSPKPGRASATGASRGSFAELPLGGSPREGLQQEIGEQLSVDSPRELREWVAPCCPPARLLGACQVHVPRCLPPVAASAAAAPQLLCSCATCIMPLRSWPSCRCTPRPRVHTDHATGPAAHGSCAPPPLQEHRRQAQQDPARGAQVQEGLGPGQRHSSAPVPGIWRQRASRALSVWPSCSRPHQQQGEQGRGLGCADHMHWPVQVQVQVCTRPLIYPASRQPADR